ncbi:MAG TPA: pyridoxamine 5'-phosphate oxidase family protein [Acidimicrobiales bacterium]|nr:pyridoxamine 5'-phosphate oxidase family protein [Acidimicrobiales bacterium]
MTALEPTPRTTVRRGKDRAEYDRATIDAILDEAFVCHAACAVDGTVWMIPTAFGRDGDRLLLHGAAANHVLRAAAAGAELTVTVTLVDGLVLARSVFNHSINYRSVTLFGHVTDITDPAGKEAALERIVEHMLPGRSDEARRPNTVELAKTRVVSLPIDEASGKVRTGGPHDDEPDLDLPVWAGVLPLRLTAGEPVADPGAGAGVSRSVNQPARWGPPTA